MRRTSNNDGDAIDDTTWVPLANRESLPLWQVVCIAGSMLSYQAAYSVVYTLGTPIFMHFESSQVVISCLWSLFPLTGFILQPVIGHYSDRSRFGLGRRRPFIIVGCVGLVFGLSVMGVLDAYGDPFAVPNPWYAVGFGLDLIWISCFLSILQGPARAVLGDLIPQSQQFSANTIASFMMSIGAWLTNLIGGLRLMQNGSFFTNEQLGILIAGILVVVGVLMTCLSAREEPLTEAPPKQNPFRDVIEAAFTLPRPVIRIAIVFFFSWMSYFPFQITLTDFFGADIYGGSSDFDSGDRKKYDDGVVFGMFVLAAVNFIVMLYTIFQSLVMKYVGMRLWYAVSHIIAAFAQLTVFVTSNRWALLGVFVFIGLALSAFNSIPFAVVGLIVRRDQMGVYMGVLNCFAVFAQELALSFVCAGLGSLFTDRAPIIGAGALFSLITAILSIVIVVPQTDDSSVHKLLAADPFMPTARTPRSYGI
jgi:solute carrier family 45 protein 1/2/4